MGDDEADQDDVETVVLPAAGTCSGEQGAVVEAGLDLGDTPGLEGLSALDFTAVQALFQQWSEGQVTSEMIVAQHGRATLEFLGSQWLVQGERNWRPRDCRPYKERLLRAPDPLVHL